jgi:hypothetical protein
MAVQTSTMSSPSQFTSPERGFLRRLIVLLLFTAGIVFWMSVLHRYQTRLSEEMMMVFADAAVALAAGLGARLTFYDRNWFIRFLAALAALILGLLGLGILTNWGLGIGPLEFWRERVDWIEIAQLGGGILVVLLSLMAWWRPAAQIEEDDVELEPARAVRRERRSRSHAPKLPHFHLPTSWTSRSTANGRLKVRKSRANGRVPHEPERVVVSRPLKPARSRRRKAAPRKPELQLSVYEEHRCPYCLEDVKRNDPRGVKECEICHTLHHADCWNVTGMCQIPHLNSLNL